MERLKLFEKFCVTNPYDFSEEEFEKVRQDIEHPRKSVVFDEYVDFNLWTRGLKSRHTYFADYISEQLPINKYKKLLEVGCGRNPRVSRLLEQKGYIMTAMDSVISCEYMMEQKGDIANGDGNEERVRKASNVTYIKAEFDFTKTDISEYDAIIAQEPCEATEHIVRACVEQKRDFIIALCGVPHVLINGEEPQNVAEWYDYLEEIGGENGFIINSKMVPGYFCPVMKGFLEGKN